MDKEKIFIINYFDKDEMRWYDQKNNKSREKYINIITGEEYNSLAEATKAKTDYLKQTKVNNVQGNVQAQKLKEMEDYKENLAKLKAVNLEEEAELQEELIQE